MSFDFKKLLKEGIKSARPYTYQLEEVDYHVDSETETEVLEEEITVADEIRGSGEEIESKVPWSRRIGQERGAASRAG